MNKKNETKKWMVQIQDISNYVYEQIAPWDMDDALHVSELFIVILYDIFDRYYFSDHIVPKETTNVGEFHYDSLQQIIDISKSHSLFMLFFKIFEQTFQLMLEGCENLERYEAAQNIKNVKNTLYDLYRMNDDNGWIIENIE